MILHYTDLYFHWKRYTFGRFDEGRGLARNARNEEPRGTIVKFKLCAGPSLAAIRPRVSPDAHASRAPIGRRDGAVIWRSCVARRDGGSAILQHGGEVRAKSGAVPSENVFFLVARNVFSRYSAITRATVKYTCSGGVVEADIGHWRV